MSEQPQTGELKGGTGKSKQEPEVRVELVTTDTPQSRKNEDTGTPITLPEPEAKESRNFC